MTMHQSSRTKTHLPGPKSLGLPARKQVFVEQYLVDLKARDAAVRAGYSARSAHVTASRLLTEPKVRTAIRDQLVERFDVTKESIIEELAAIAFSDITDVVSWTESQISVRPSHELSPGKAKAISKLRMVKTRYGETFEVKFADKLKALALLAEVLGMLGNSPPTARVLY